MAAGLGLDRILVTGAAGFVGLHLQAELARAFPKSEIVAGSADVSDLAAVQHEIARLQPGACIHLAAISAVASAQSDPILAWRVNLGGTLNVARALMAVPGSTLIYASTADAYGVSFNSGTALTEAAALNPANTYGATKAAADLALGAMAREGLHAIRVRPFNHTGPGQSANFAVPAFACQIARISAGYQPPVLDVGSLDARRDFLDVRDVCRAYAACLQNRDDLPAGTVLNIASGVQRRIGDVLAEMLEVAGVDAEIRVDPARLRPSEIPIAAGDASLARRVLKWAPHTAWRQTLADVLADWRGRAGPGPG